MLVGTYCEKKDKREPTLFLVTPTWNSFRDGIKEQYYPMGSYVGKYIQWTTMCEQRDQDVHKLTNLFHTLCTKLGIKYLEIHLVLKYRSCLHRHMQEEMEFLDITSLGTTYHYAARIEQKFKQNKRDFGSANPKLGKGAPKPQNKGQRQSRVTQKNTKNTMKDTGKLCEFHNSPTQCKRVSGQIVIGARTKGT